MFRLINGVTARVRVCPTPKLRSSPSSPLLISPSTSRSIYSAPGFLTSAYKTRRRMAETVPQTRPLSEVEVDQSEVLSSVEKKPRLGVEVERSEGQTVASTSTATVKQKPANREKLLGKRGSSKKKRKHLPPEPYSYDDVLWRDVRDLLGVGVADGIIKEGKEWESPFEYGEELEVEVSAISSTGVSSSQ
jgi:hypothetical protein